MKSKRRTWSRSSAPLAGLVLALLVAIAAFLHAHDEGDAPHGGHPPLHAIDTMHAFHDHHEPESLASMSITSCVGGLAGTYPCSNVDLMAFLPLDQIGGGQGNDIWGWTDPETGKEYAIMGRTNGTSFVDVSDPVNPVYLGNLPTHAAGSSWRDIKVHLKHAFMVTEAVNSGMQVFDLTQLGNVAAPPVTFSETAWYGGIGTAHNLVINEDSGFAYAVGTNTGNCGRGLHFINIQNPTNPVAAGCFAGDGYTHDAQCVIYSGPDTAHQGQEICFAYNEDTLTIVDVTNKSMPVQLSRTGYAKVQYTHQGWLTEDHTHLLLDDELDERNDPSVPTTRTHIWDVSDLDAPVNTGYYSASTTVIDHNQYIKGSYSYQANYEAGLRILDISGIASASLTEVAYFDIYPSSDTTNFNGAWSNYPYFDSDIVVVSGIQQGLFILKPNLGGTSNPPAVTIVNPAQNDTVGGNVPIEIDATDEDPAGSLMVEWNADGGPWQPTSDSGVWYVAVWDTSLVGNGLVTVNARAIDSTLRVGSDSVDVNVFNTLPAFHIDSVQVVSVPVKGPRNRGVATVTVLSQGGAAVDGVSVTGNFSGDWSGSRSGTTDAGGQMQAETPPVKNGANWTFCVDSAVKTGWTYDETSSTVCGSTGGAGGSGTISGLVTDSANSQPVSGANVSVDTGQNDTTDGSGNYSLSPVPAGTRTVSVTASGYEPQNQQTIVTDGQDTPVNFALVAETSGGSGTIKGTVRDTSGTKLGDVVVSTDTGPSAITNKGGKYTIQDVPAGSRIVTASRIGYVTQQKAATVTAGSTETVDFALAPE